MRNKFTVKIISFAIMLSMILPFSVFAAESENTDRFSESLSLLSGLNLADSESFKNPSENVKRNEFVKIILKFLGYEDFKSTEADVYFSDVDADHPDAEYIYAGKRLGILNGFSDGRFYPQSNLTFDQAVKVISSSLGYDIIANAKGGYPAGYKIAANENGLLDGVSQSTDITKENLLYILENALDAKVKGMGALGGKSIALTDTGTFLEVYHKIYTHSGIVTATKDNAEYSYGTVGENYLAIGDYAFKTGSLENTEGLFGYNVTAYYKKLDGDAYGTLVYLKTGKENKTLTIKADDITSSNNYTLNYKENKSNKTLNYKDITVVYNGKIDYGYSFSDLKPDCGEITFLDNNRDGKYEYAFVFSASYGILLSETAKESDKIYVYDKITNTAVLELKAGSAEKNFNVYRNGLRTDISSLSENDYILVGVSKDSDYYVLNASSSEVIKGTVDSVGDDFITVDSKKYKLNKLYRSNIGASDYYAKLTPGITAEIRLDMYGDAALLYEIKGDELKYGFIIDLESLTGHKEFKPWYIKVLSEESQICTFELPEKLMFNGSKTDAEKVVKKLYEGDGIADMNKKDELMHRQLIKYKLNDDSQVLKELYTSADTEKLKYNGSFTQQREYDYYLSSWGRQYYRDLNTKIFHIYDEEDYCKVDSSYSQWQITPTATCHFYNTSDTLVSGAVVRYYAGTGSDKSGEVSENRGVVIAEGVVTALDYSENAVKAISGYTLSGAKATILPGKFTNDYVKGEFDAVVNSLNAGDIIVYDNDSSGSLRAVGRVVDVSKPDYFGSNGDVSETAGHGIANPQSSEGQEYLGYYDKTRWNIFGKVVKVINDYIIYDVNGKKTREPAKGVTSALVTVRNDGAEITYNYDCRKARTDDRIFAWGKWQVTKEIVIIRYE